MAQELENHPDNPCFGCGPANPAGLQLRFFQEGDTVRSSLTAREDLQGFPGTMHTAFLYLALVEVMNWTVWASLGRAGVPRTTGALETLGRVPVGARVELVGRMTGDAAARGEAFVGGELVAVLEREYVLPTRAEVEERLPEGAGHASLEGMFPG